MSFLAISSDTQLVSEIILTTPNGPAPPPARLLEKGPQGSFY